jgi:hypothetical protein
MSGYYRRYETLGDLSFCLGKDNSILSVENIGTQKIWLKRSDDSVFSLKPGETLSFGPNMKLYQDDLKEYKDKQRLNYRDDEEDPEDGDTGGWDCYD